MKPLLFLTCLSLSCSVSASSAMRYQQYIDTVVGRGVVDISELTTNRYILEKTNRLNSCRDYAHEVPSKEQYKNIVKTIKLVSYLKTNGVISDYTILSSYRSHKGNVCTGGAKNSKHLNNAAIDFTVPEKDIHAVKKMCAFWKTYGKQHNMGLGTYTVKHLNKNITIFHVDVEQYRTWGSNYKSNTSLCL